MAQSVRRPETLGAMDHEPQRDKTRTSYFGNVKTRSGLVRCLDYWGAKKGGKALSTHVTGLAGVCSSDLRSYNQVFHHFGHILAQNAHFLSAVFIHCHWRTPSHSIMWGRATACCQELTFLAIADDTHSPINNSDQTRRCWAIQLFTPHMSDESSNSWGELEGNIYSKMICAEIT